MQWLSRQSRVRQKPAVSTSFLCLDIYLGKLVSRPTNTDAACRWNWWQGQPMPEFNTIDSVWWALPVQPDFQGSCRVLLKIHQCWGPFCSLSWHSQWQGPTLYSGQDLVGCALGAGSQLPLNLKARLQAASSPGLLRTAYPAPHPESLQVLANATCSCPRDFAECEVARCDSTLEAVMVIPTQFSQGHVGLP